MHPGLFKPNGHALRKRAPHVAQFATTKILETEPHPEPLAKRIENVSLATFFDNLKGGVRGACLMDPIHV